MNRGLAEISLIAHGTSFQCKIDRMLSQGISRDPRKIKKSWDGFHVGNLDY